MANLPADQQKVRHEECAVCECMIANGSGGWVSIEDYDAALAEIERLRAMVTQFQRDNSALISRLARYESAADVGGGEPLTPVFECIHCHKKFLTFEVGLDHEEHCPPRSPVRRSVTTKGNEDGN